MKSDKGDLESIGDMIDKKERLPRLVPAYGGPPIFKELENMLETGLCSRAAALKVAAAANIPDKSDELERRLTARDSDATFWQLSQQLINVFTKYSQMA